MIYELQTKSYRNQLAFSGMPCIVLTATVQVKQDMCFTVRRDTDTRYADYKSAFRQWVAAPEVRSLVLVENSGFDLSEFAEIAKGFPDKQIELMSFVCEPFDGALGKGYGEMLILQYCLDHSSLLRNSPTFLKVTGRYYVRNIVKMLEFLSAHPEAEVICDLCANLTWADSKVFGGKTEFLRNYLCPMLEEINDTLYSSFEQVLARAIHHAMADRAVWIPFPEPMDILGFSGSQGFSWQTGPLGKLKKHLLHRLFLRLMRRGA